MRRSILIRVVVALTSLAAVGGCSLAGGSASSSSASPTASVPAVVSASATAVDSEVVSTAAALEPYTAPSSQCAAMNEVLLTALEELPQGRAYTSAPTGAQDRQPLWGAFTQVLEDTYGARLQETAGTDAVATSALKALTEYNSAFARLTSGDVVEFSDPQTVQEAIAEGSAPAADPEYLRTVDAMTTAHVTLTQCLPDWPLVF
ncbi:hypothetical protein [Actinomyces faecalis]|uniref:hypothetical protein n=1 Tax=Actinomyces faecalis TaxID=2722820 RepID=UPI001557F796|nr:hypothetical protein [Actinomyces faecalis]